MINVRNLINDYCNDSFSSKEKFNLWVLDRSIHRKYIIAWQEILNGYVPNNKLVKFFNYFFVRIDNYNNFNWHEHLRWAVFNIISGHNLIILIFRQIKSITH